MAQNISVGVKDIQVMAIADKTIAYQEADPSTSKWEGTKTLKGDPIEWHPGDYIGTTTGNTKNAFGELWFEIQYVMYRRYTFPIPGYKVSLNDEGSLWKRYIIEDWFKASQLAVFEENYIEANPNDKDGNGIDDEVDKLLSEVSDKPSVGNNSPNKGFFASIFGPSTPTYDANGNVTSGNPNSLAYIIGALLAMALGIAYFAKRQQKRQQKIK